MSFSSLNVGPSIGAYWWIEIEGLRKRYSTYAPSWNPADSGTNRRIEAWLVEPPRIGAQSADPLNGRSEISQHSFRVLDRNDEITDLLSSASVGDKAFLTHKISTGTCSEIVVDDYSDLPSSGHLYMDRETFYYTTKDAAKAETGLFSQSSGTKTALASTAITLSCSALTEDNGHWEGAICQIITGDVANVGQRRTVYRSTGSNPLDGTESEWADVGDTELPNTLYFDPANPLPAAIGAGDTFALTQPPRRVRLTGASGATDDYWDGAVLTVTADPVNAINVNESRIVTAFNATTKTFTLNEPLPEPLDFGSPGLGYATVSLAKYSLSGISRGLYKSRQEEHDIVDRRGDYTPIEITTRPMFIKTRRVWIYEGRVGCAEADAKRRQGILSDVSLSPDMATYDFSVDSMQRLLAQKILQKPWTGTVHGLPLWGGAISVPNLQTSWYLPGFVPASDDGNLNVSVWYIRAKSTEAPRARGNIRIGNELIHYRDSVFYQPKLSGGGCYELRLGETNDSRALEQIWGFDAWWAIRDQGYLSHEIENWCAQSRGLLSRHCGKKSVSKWTGNNPHADRWKTEQCIVYVPSFIEEHNAGDDIKDACFCDDSSMSDFVRIDLLELLPGSSSGTLQPGDVITGDASFATGVVNGFYADGTNCRIWIRRDDSDSSSMGNDFIDGDAISGPGGWSGEIGTFTRGDGKSAPARNNPLNVILAMLLSDGVSTDKQYGYLPVGWGLGLDEDDVDIAGIEDLRDRFFSQVRVNFAITEPVDFAEWSEQLFRSLCIFPFETTDGKLSLGYMLTEQECVDQDAGGLLVIDDDVLEAKSAPDWTSGRSPITKIEVKYNKNPCSDDWYGKLEVNFARSKGTAWDYGRAEKIECQTLYVPDNAFDKLDPRDPEMPDLIARLINPLWGRHTLFPAPVVRVSVPYSYDSEIEIGDVVKLSHDKLPNLRTGARGFSNEYFQVISKEADAIQGTCGMELWQIGIHDSKYGKSSPSAVVTYYSGDTPSSGKSRIFVQTQAYGKQGYDPDASYFSVGDEICLLSAVGDPLSSPVENATVEAVNDTIGSLHYIQLDQNLTTPPGAGAIVTIPEYDNAASSRRSKNVFLAGEDRRIGSGGDAAFRYH